MTRGIRVAAAGLLFATMFACTQQTGQGARSAGPGGASALIGPDTGTFAFPGNDEGNVLFAPGAGSIARGNASGGFSAWTSVGTLPFSRGSAAGAASNGHFYVIGGNGGIKDILVAAIRDDGTLGSFSQTTPLPENRASAGAVAWNGTLYVVGGRLDNAGGTAAVTAYKIKSDGTLGPATSATAMPDASYGMGVVVAGGYLYTVAGRTAANGYRANVRYAPINADGSLGGWQETTPILGGVSSDNTAAVYNGRIYYHVAVPGAGANTLQSAPIGTDGKVGAWRTERLPPYTGFGITLQAAGGVLAMMGGDAFVYSAQIGEGGVLSPWVKSAAIANGIYVASAVWNDRLYVAGGGSGATTAEVRSAAVGGPPTLWTQQNGSGLKGYRGAATAYNGYAYMAAGFDSNSSGIKDVVYAALNTDGSVGGSGWQSAAPIPDTPPFILPSALVGYNGRLYLFGATDKIFISNIGAGGAPGPWVISPVGLPAVLAAAAVAIVGDYLFIGGGVDKDNVNVPTLYTFAIDRVTGALSIAGVGALPRTVAFHALVSDGSRLYLVGGVNLASGSADNTEVNAAVVDTATGRLGPWSVVSHLPDTRNNAGTVVHAGTLVLAGGAYQSNAGGGYSSNDVFTASLDAASGAVGPWVRRAANWPARAYGPLVSSGNALVQFTGLLQTQTSTITLLDTWSAPSSFAGTVGPFVATTGIPSASGRNGIAAAATASRVYLLGGSADAATGASYLNNVTSFPINPDGTLGAAASESPLGTARAQPAALAVNNFVYAAGGVDASKYYTTVEFSPSGTAGLGGFQATTPFSGGRYHHGLASYGGFLYVYGGADGSSLKGDVQSAPLGNDGTVGAWTNAGQLTAPRASFGAVAYNGTLYALGGQLAGGSTTSVEYAPILPGGAVGGWRGGSSLHTTDPNGPVFAFAQNGVLYLVDGTGVQSAVVHADGSLGDWQITSTGYGPRTSEAAALGPSAIYVLGGSVPGTSSVLSDIQLAPLYQTPPRAAYSRLFDLGAVQNSADTITVSGSALPGKVLLDVATAGADGKFTTLFKGALAALGTPIALGVNGVRWVQARLLLDDSQGPYDGAARDVTGLGVGYTAAPTQLVFKTPPLTLTPGVCATGTLALLDSTGAPAKTSILLPATLSPASPIPAGALFAGSTCTGPSAPSYAFAPGTDSLPFSVLVTSAGTGDVVFTATATGLPAATQTEKLVAGPAHHLNFTAQPADSVAGLPLAAAPAVALFDVAGNPVGDPGTVTVALAAGSPAGTLTGDLVQSISTSTATFTNLSIDKAGSGFKLAVQLASKPSLTATSSAFNVNTPPPPAQLVFTAAAPAKLVAGVCNTFTLGLRDSGGKTTNTPSALAVSVASTGIPAQTFTACGGAASATLAFTAGASTLSFGLRSSGAGTGTLTVSATAAALPASGQTATQLQTVVPGAADHLAFTTQPVDAIAGQPLPTAPVVTVYDGVGNVATGYGDPVVASLAAGSPAGPLTGTTSVFAVLGVATFSGLKVGSLGTGYKLSVALATPGSVAPATSAGFNVSPAPFGLAFGPPPGARRAGDCVGPLEVRLVDSGQQPLVAAAAVTFALTGVGPGTARLSFFGDAGCALAAPGQIAAGNSTVQVWMRAPAGGQYALTSTSGTLASGAASLDFSAPPAGQVHLNGWGCASSAGGESGLLTLLGGVFALGRARRRRQHARPRGHALWPAALLALLALSRPVLALPEAPATAAAKNANDEAKALFIEGQSEYDLGHFKEALGFFEKAYKKKAVPALLYNVAQCHRMLGDLKSARSTYRSFLMNAPDSPVAPAAREKLAEVEAALSAQFKVQSSLPTGIESPDKPSERPQDKPQDKPAEKAALVPPKIVVVEQPPVLSPPPLPPPAAQAPAAPAPASTAAPKPSRPAQSEAAKRPPALADGQRSFGPNVYFGAVSDPKNKEVGLEAALLLSFSETLSLLAGAAIGEHLGLRAAAFFRLTELGSLRLWAGPRLLLTPGSDGTSVGGGAQLRAELQLAPFLDVVGAAAVEAYSTPAGTTVAPLLTAGLQTRF